MAGIKIKKMKAHSSRIHARRAKESIIYIVFHYTGNVGDTSENNGKYFSRSDLPEIRDAGNPRHGVGAHFFVDKAGNIVMSIPINRVAYSVGGKYSTANGAGSYYLKCTNSNSVSIELCDCTKGVSWEQLLAAKKLVGYIQKRCPNAKTIIRHWDVNGKSCPAPMVGKDNVKWKHLHNMVTNGYQFKAEVMKRAVIRSSRGVEQDNKLGVAPVGSKVKIVRVVGNWGRLFRKTSDGKCRWINLNKVREI